MNLYDYNDIVKLEKRKETRRWITQIWFPIIWGCGAILYFNDPLRNKLQQTCKKIKNKIMDI